MNMPEVSKHDGKDRLHPLLHGLTGIRSVPENNRFSNFRHPEVCGAIKKLTAWHSDMAVHSCDLLPVHSPRFSFREPSDSLSKNADELLRVRTQKHEKREAFFIGNFGIHTAAAPWNPTPEIFFQSGENDRAAPLSACGHPQDMPFFFTQQAHSFSDFCIDENNQYTKYGNGKNSDTPAQVHARCNERLLTDIHTDSRCVEYDTTSLPENGIYRFYPAISRASPQGACIL